jgi:hypothetical protein
MWLEQANKLQIHFYLKEYEIYFKDLSFTKLHKEMKVNEMSLVLGSPIHFIGLDLTIMFREHIKKH